MPVSFGILSAECTLMLNSVNLTMTEASSEFVVWSSEEKQNRKIDIVLYRQLLFGPVCIIDPQLREGRAYHPYVFWFRKHVDSNLSVDEVAL